MGFHRNNGPPIHVLAYYDFLEGGSFFVLFEDGEQFLLVPPEAARQLTQRTLRFFSVFGNEQQIEEGRLSTK
jgi:hypothetical protein